MCGFYRFLYSILPFKKVKSTLTKKHFLACEACQTNIKFEKLLSEVKAIGAWASKENSLWPGIRANIQIRESEKVAPEKNLKFHSFRIWRWAASFAFVSILAAVSFLLQTGQKKIVPSEAVQSLENLPKVILKKAELKGIKARPIIYQTSTVSIIFLVEDKEPGGTHE